MHIMALSIQRATARLDEQGEFVAGRHDREDRRSVELQSQTAVWQLVAPVG